MTMTTGANSNNSIEIPALDRLMKMKPYLEKILPNEMSADRSIMSAISELKNNPALNSCCPKSICGGILRIAQMGLEIGSVLGKVYLVPFNGEITLMLGYRGMLDLIRRSPDVFSIKSACVYSNDLFEFEDGSTPHIKHVRKWSDRGDLLGVFAIVIMKNGYFQYEMMSVEEVDKIRSKSPGRNSKPWINYYEEMAKKTVIRRLFKTAPSSIETIIAMELDEKAEYGDQNLKSALKEFGLNDEDSNVIAIQSQSDKLAEKISNIGE
jgi:recombination protein RecT